MKLIDKSGGFWFDIIRRKMNARMAFQQNYTPDAKANNMLAEEIISGIKGSVKHSFSVRHTKGKLTIARFSGPKYSTGIMQRKSPDGEPYAPLSPYTLSLRKAMGNNRGPAFILRETGKHIMDGLKILSRKYGTKNTTIEIGWQGFDDIVAQRQNSGFEDIPDFNVRGKKPKTLMVKVVPARPFIGISVELRKNLQTVWNKITRV